MKIRRTSAVPILALLLAAPALADDGLAAPGPCAERRAPARTGPVEEDALAPPPQDVFALAGDPAQHFDPTQVGADLPAPGVEDRPEAAFGSLREACDAPDAGCNTALTTQAQGGPALVEQPPVGGLPPGVGQDRP